ncbi:hypothetical protein [Hymenobacter negativus]|uniref:Uncharacterized protein n=1 Tax=Hymenobacter negativus TaxID=2795026 RepID=A0ABS3QHW9_9BACT|nr:hypothetical protein [Hymenobacter negativus]MBO2010843.1 hypothetical protein [Hymenobacter negativus]
MRRRIIQAPFNGFGTAGLFEETDLRVIVSTEGGGWQVGDGSVHSGGYCYYTTRNGATATWSMWFDVPMRFDLISILAAGLGSISVSMDGTTLGTFSQAAPTTVNAATVWTSPVIQPGPHTVVETVISVGGQVSIVDAIYFYPA